jgi:hypothetical protein
VTVSSPAAAPALASRAAADEGSATSPAESNYLQDAPSSGFTISPPCIVIQPPKLDRDQ